MILIFDLFLSIGAVYLNLAEYVGKGKVERRYLLKESRVNATLKVSRPFRERRCFVIYERSPITNVPQLGLTPPSFIVPLRWPNVADFEFF